MGEIGGHQIGLEPEILGRGQRAAAKGIDARAEAGVHRLAGEDRPKIVEAVRLKPADGERPGERHPRRILAGREQGAGRKSVVEGKSVSVRVDLGGRRIYKKQTTNKYTSSATQYTSPKTLTKN